MPSPQLVSHRARLALACLAIASFGPAPASALSELLETYSAPQALATGNAMTADAHGYLSLYYNPAGLAKMPKRRTELHLVAAEGTLGTGGLGRAWEAASFGVYRMMGALQASPGSYSFLRGALQGSLSRRNFGVSWLATHESAAVSDGTSVDIDARVDLGVTAGAAIGFFDNLGKIGVAGKFLVRNQLKGTFAHSDFSGGDDAIASRMKEGYGIGADAGLVFTAPYRYLPTIGFAWRDIGGTRFQAVHVMNDLATGAPDAIPQSFHAGISFQPRLSRRLRVRLAGEWKHIERSDLPLRKRIHVGAELSGLDRAEKIFLWVGLSQLLPTGGFGWRVPGGNLEVGLYAKDIGEGDVVQADWRFFFRYTVSFE